MRPIDADALRERMYHDAFEVDSDMQRWDSGCWIRYKMFENAIDDAPTIEPNLQPTCNQLATDCISRQAAIDCMMRLQREDEEAYGASIPEGFDGDRAAEALMQLPYAQPELRYDEWCTDCKEYDHERHCCPRWNHVIRTTLQDAQHTGRWIWDDEGYHCSECFYHAYGNTSEVMLGDFKFCPNCGARMEVEE